MNPRILFISGREINYIRNHILIKSLSRYFDLEIVTSSSQSIIGRTLLGLGRFLFSKVDYDVCFVGFYGQPLAIALSVLQKKPIILDAYVSTYDTLCEDRMLFSPNSVWANIASWLDHRSLEVADQIITDTRSDAEYLIKRYGVSDKIISTVYVGCDESIFYPKEHSFPDSGRFEVFYYGSFLPLHGTEVIVRAAETLKQRSDIHFTIGGMGPEYNRIELMVMERHLQNVTLVNWIKFDQLAYHIDRADICLGGHFSTSSKANRVISTKTYQFLAKQKPTIVSDSDASREVFIDRKHVLMVPMGDTESLADAIVELVEKQDLRTYIAENGYRIFKQRFTIRVIARQLSNIVESVL